jgi:hypothetical protein
MRMRILLCLAAIACCCWLGTAVSAATLTATIIETDTSDYAPGDSVVITGTGYWPSEQVSVEITNVLNPGIGDSDGPWYLSADASGNFTTYWVVPPEGVDQQYQATAIGLSSGIVSTAFFTDAHGIVQLRIAVAETLPRSPTAWSCSLSIQEIAATMLRKMPVTQCTPTRMVWRAPR